jgi:prevent-host-death family protein
MERVNLADAKTHLSELVTRASQGEAIEIVRRGKTVARLLPPETPRKSFDWEALDRLTRNMTPQKESAGDFMRKLRDSGY